MIKMTNIIDFLGERKVQKVVGISGGAEGNDEARVKALLEQSMAQYAGKPIAILTGGTKWGVPKYATDLAKDANLPVIGVLPERGTKYKLDNLDYEVVVPSRLGDSEYGDESEVFVKLINGLQIIGGGAGTLVEFAHAMKINDRRIKDGKDLIVIAPVSGFGGTAEDIYSMAATRDICRKYTGEFIAGTSLTPKIFHGANAANYLLRHWGM
jgi:predicted Rossmann-fold nucleotide-binding protein